MASESLVLTRISQQLKQKANSTDFQEIESTDEWLVLREVKTGNFDITHLPSLTYSKIKLLGGAQFSMKLYSLEDNERVYNVKWILTHSRKARLLFRV